MNQIYILKIRLYVFRCSHFYSLLFDNMSEGNREPVPSCTLQINRKTVEKNLYNWEATDMLT